MQKGKFPWSSSALEARKERSCQSYSASHIKWRAERSFHRQTFIHPGVYTIDAFRYVFCHSYYLRLLWLVQPFYRCFTFDWFYYTLLRWTRFVTSVAGVANYEITVQYPFAAVWFPLIWIDVRRYDTRAAIYKGKGNNSYLSEQTIKQFTIGEQGWRSGVAVRETPTTNVARANAVCGLRCC